MQRSLRPVPCRKFWCNLERSRLVCRAGCGRRLRTKAATRRCCILAHQLAWQIPHFSELPSHLSQMNANASRPAPKQQSRSTPPEIRSPHLVSGWGGRLSPAPLGAFRPSQDQQQDNPPQGAREPRARRKGPSIAWCLYHLPHPMSELMICIVCLISSASPRKLGWNTDCTSSHIPMS